MKKKFVFLGFHVGEQINKTNLKKWDFVKKNPVMFKTDRFLEKEFMDKIGLNAQRRPYTLVVNTAGCNKNCWFCYAYPIVKKEDYNKCYPMFLSPEELTQCFVEQLSRLKNIVTKKHRYFSKIRITGGEPLFSTNDTLKNEKNLTDKELENNTIDYFLNFFELLDKEVEKLVANKVIYLSEPKKYDEKVHFPTFIVVKEERIDVRFDTNGFLFSNLDFADRFVGGIYNLFIDNKLNNLRIEIDYSLKGVYPIDVFWSQRQKLPVDKDKIVKFNIEEHPQYPGLKNIFELIKKYGEKGKDFYNCIGITVEPGLSNVKRNYLNFERSLNWGLIEQKLKERLGENFRLSKVDNKMEVRGKISTHLNRGAAIGVIYDGGSFICYPHDSKEKRKELFNLLRKLKKENKEYAKIYLPYAAENAEDKQSELTNS